MRKWMRMAAPLAVCGLLAGLASCEGEQGPAGADTTAQCMRCHTDDADPDNEMDYYIRTIQTQFALSQHNLSDTYVRRGSESSPTCSRCHTTEGYQYYLETGDEAPMDETSHISCFACHAPHTTGDFTLRKEGPTEMFVGDTYDHESSNTCAVCHQARPPEPAIDVATPFPNTRWGPHHSPQSNILSATGAWPMPGSTFDVEGTHGKISNGCVTCHMAALPDNTIAGAHSFAINYESSGNVVVNSKGCSGPNSCHIGWTDALATTDVDASQVNFEEELEELGDLLFARGWINTARDAVVPANSPTNANDRGAIWNYLLLHDDQSMGVHNPRYARSVIEGTVAYLNQSASR